MEAELLNRGDGEETVLCDELLGMRLLLGIAELGIDRVTGKTVDPTEVGEGGGVYIVA